MGISGAQIRGTYHIKSPYVRSTKGIIIAIYPSDSHWNSQQHADCMTLGGYWHILASFYVSYWDPGRGYLHILTSFYVSFWDPGRGYLHIFASFDVSFWDPGKKCHGNHKYRTEVEEYEGTVIYRTLLFYNSVFLGRYEKKRILTYFYFFSSFYNSGLFYNSVFHHFSHIYQFGSIIM